MNDNTPRNEKLLDRLLQEIRSEELDAETSAAATERVLARVRRSLGAHGEPLRGCADVRPLLGELAAGRLAPDRAVLVTDHARTCPGCRRALAAARSGLVLAPAPTATPAHPAPWRRVWLPAAAAVVIGLGLLGAWRAADISADHRLRATVTAVDGALRMVSDGSSSALAPGATIRAAQRVRTAKQSGAVLRLGDGSTIEMAARSELQLHGSRRGTTVQLARGDIIVHAAHQGGGRLVVRTADCRVVVKGTIFAVDSGLKGSRVSVIQGEVEVRDAAGRALLSPGQQLTTSDLLETVPIADQIAWSRNAEDHMELLRELGSLRRDVMAAIEPTHPRTSTELLDLAPPDTVAYVALPNLAQGLTEARLLLEQRLAEQPLLAEWWQRKVVASGIQAQIDELVDRLQPLAGTIGDEVVVAVPAAALSDDGGPLVMARLEDPVSFVRVLRDEVARVNGSAERPIIAFADDPAATAAEVVVRVSGDLFAATTRPSLLAALAARQADPSASAFSGTELYQRLEARYREGVSWLVGIDLGHVMDAASGTADRGGAQALEKLGLLDATTLVMERHRVGERSSTTAELRFAGPRRGMAGWLAAPAPMGSLGFVSPRAAFAAAVVAKEPRLMLDELVAAVSEGDPGALDELEGFQTELGLDLRSDLAASLGGEAAFAVDGPLLPKPAWKLVVEIYDPATFQAAVERAVAEVNRRLAAAGRPSLALSSVTDGGRTYSTLRDPASGFAVVWVVSDGYLLVGPQVAVLEQALGQRAAGVTLTTSDTFQSLLPDNGYTNCSAMVYRDLSGLAGQVGGSLPAAAALAEPGLICVYGEPDRILLAGSGSGLLEGMADAGMLAAGARSSLSSPR